MLYSKQSQTEKTMLMESTDKQAHTGQNTVIIDNDDDTEEDNNPSRPTPQTMPLAQTVRQFNAEGATDELVIQPSTIYTWMHHILTSMSLTSTFLPMSDPSDSSDLGLITL